ncbi:unnamed protein product [Miscanthus lutarioriparius]|uniref:Uncharacterized protein n=1 Tax=Miscanthus lutarioriparius TaxID=422564 RepID=A0A811PRM2_9POAL|nr:unnamed protein product [Miscanthus lutarioriparius]
MRPRSELLVIPRSAELNAVESALSSLALVAMVGGNRPPVSPADVRRQLVSFYNLPADAFSVCRYAPEDFLVRFNNADDLEDVLQGPVPMGTPFYLRWCRWRRQSMATSGSLKYKVLIGLKGMPAHIRGIHSTQRILGTSCANLVPAPASAAGEDLREFVVAAWCVHPDFIPHERLIAIPEPEVPFVVEPTLYLREHEVIHSELPVLQYGVRIRIIEVQDWTAPPSSSDDAPGDSDDNNNPYRDFGGGRSGHWPRPHGLCWELSVLLRPRPWATSFVRARP